MDGDCGDLAEFTSSNYLTISATSNCKNSQVVDGDRGDLAEFGKKTQIMIFLPHYMWAENYKGHKILE